MREGELRTFGHVEAANAGSLSVALPVAGIVIRYGFYFFGMLLAAMMAFGGYTLWGYAGRIINEPPAFRIAGSFAQLPSSGHIVASRALGRIEVRQYGQLHNRDQDFALAMFMPRDGSVMSTAFAQDMSEANLLRGARAVNYARYYDLDTRFGDVRANDMRVNTDGLWKQCIAFRTRFDTSAVYFAGWYCDASGTKPGPEFVACAIDRLVLDKELASKEADAFIRARMARPANCAARPVNQTSDTRQNNMARPQRWSQPTAKTRW
jgi:hypothetical protein